MNVSSVLFDILVVLVAAKLAAEIAERIGIPTVVGEMLAGLVVGPSVLHLVGADNDVLHTLGQIGVILLLLEVGMEMDLVELRAVGRASVLVAIVGVVGPLVLGIGAMAFVVDDFNTALFVASALTATSVGITARVFGDLRALASIEARIVLGAAVADDLIGLMVLTVVVRLVTEGSVSALAVVGIAVVAIGFLVVGGFAGLRIAPPLFALVERVSRSTGTLVALGLAFTLAFAQVAEAARLAPIIGAFLAGLALARSAQSTRIARELAPVGHLFIPVFFLQIGIDVQIESFADPSVLRDAAILLVVAVIGKLISPLGTAGSPGDKLLIGLGMLPRGEVGLIFATIGLETGVLNAELYASLIIVVLITTLVTPQLLSLRYKRLRSDPSRLASPIGEPRPATGWVALAGREVSLQAAPPAHAALDLAFHAALLVRSARPSAPLLDWLGSLPDTPLQWDRRATDAFLKVVEQGNERSWRFLETIAILERALPELSDALRERAADPFELDPTALHRWQTIERLREAEGPNPAAAELDQLEHPEWLLLAAFLIDVLDGSPERVATARRVVGRLGIGARAEQEIALLVGDADLLMSVARHPDGLSEESVLAVASHIDTPEHARALYALTMAQNADLGPADQEALRALHELVQVALTIPELTGLETRNLVGRRRADARRVAPDDPDVVERIERAPIAYTLSQDAMSVARHAALAAYVGRRGLLVEVTDAPGGYIVDVVAHDRPALLASVTGALNRADLDVEHAVVATWPDGVALESFTVRADARPDPDALREGIEAAVDEPLSAPPLPASSIAFDHRVSPWHTVCEVTAADAHGLLHTLASAIAAAGVSIHAARATSTDGIAHDRFELTDSTGRKLDERDVDAVVKCIRNGVVTRGRWIRRRAEARPSARSTNGSATETGHEASLSDPL